MIILSWNHTVPFLNNIYIGCLQINNLKFVICLEDNPLPPPTKKFTIIENDTSLETQQPEKFNVQSMKKFSVLI